MGHGCLKVHKSYILKRLEVVFNGLTSVLPGRGIVYRLAKRICISKPSCTLKQMCMECDGTWQMPLRIYVGKMMHLCILNT